MKTYNEQLTDLCFRVDEEFESIRVIIGRLPQVNGVVFVPLSTLVREQKAKRRYNHLDILVKYAQHMSNN